MFVVTFCHAQCCRQAYEGQRHIRGPRWDLIPCRDTIIVVISGSKTKGESWSAVLTRTGDLFAGAKMVADRGLSTTGTWAADIRELAYRLCALGLPVHQLSILCSWLFDAHNSNTNPAATVSTRHIRRLGFTRAAKKGRCVRVH